MNPPTIGSIVDYQYDPTLVFLSFLISLLGSYVALQMASSRDTGHERAFGAALALGGCGIWAMHFIAMTAYKTPLAMSYSLWPTLLSLAIVVTITFVGFRVAILGRGRLTSLLAGGFIIGTGVVAMHYSGMAGLTVQASFAWNWLMVGASCLIAVVAATVALWLAFNVRTTTQRVAAALAMGVAVCAMHYESMAAVTLICISKSSRGTLELDGPYLPYFTFSLALITLTVSVLIWKIRDARFSPVAA